MSVRTYNPSVRVGNWNEDIQLEEVTVLQISFESAGSGNIFTCKSHWREAGPSLGPRPSCGVGSFRFRGFRFISLPSFLRCFIGWSKEDGLPLA